MVFKFLWCWYFKSQDYEVCELHLLAIILNRMSLNKQQRQFVLQYFCKDRILFQIDM